MFLKQHVIAQPKSITQTIIHVCVSKDIFCNTKIVNWMRHVTARHKFTTQNKTHAFANKVIVYLNLDFVWRMCLAIIQLKFLIKLIKIAVVKMVMSWIAAILSFVYCRLFAKMIKFMYYLTINVLI